MFKFLVLPVICSLIMPLRSSASSEDQPGSAESGNYALHFDGVDDVVDLGSQKALQGASALTVEMWVKVDSLIAWRSFFSKRVGDYNRIQFQEYRNPGDIGIAVSSGKRLGYYHTNGSPLPAGAWCHLTMVYDGSRAKNRERLKLLINGTEVPVESETRGGMVPDLTPENDAPVLLGGANANSVWGFKGAMDDLRIWTIARTDEEVLRDMKESNPDPTTRGLYSAFDFEERSGTGLPDNVSTGDGVLRNFALAGKHSNWVEHDLSVPQPAPKEAGTALRVARRFSQAGGLTCVNLTATEVTLTWSKGGGDGRAVFISGDSSAAFPQSLQSREYRAATLIGAGDLFGQWSCVKWADEETSVTVTGLEPGRFYSAAVVEYRKNNSAIKWQIAQAEKSMIRFMTPYDQSGNLATQTGRDSKAPVCIPSNN